MHIIAAHIHPHTYIHTHTTTHIHPHTYNHTHPHTPPGVVFALLASLAVKSKYFRSQDMPLESILVVLLAYSSYMLADGLKLSGIVAILFCGMVCGGRVWRVYGLVNAKREQRSMLNGNNGQFKMGIACMSLTSTRHVEWCPHTLHIHSTYTPHTLHCPTPPSGHGTLHAPQSLSYCS